MPMDEAMFASVREANGPYLAGYERRLAAEIVVAMLPEAPEDAREVLRVVDVILNLTLKPREPQPSEPRPPDAA